MRKLFSCIPFLFVLVSCFPEPWEDGLTVASWNTYLMFDGNDDGREYPPFSGDNREVFLKRSKDTADVLASLGADIIVLQEIESSDVLEQLIDDGLGRQGFRYYALGGGSPVSVAFISRIEPESVLVHSANGFRPFIEATFRVGRERVRIFMIHARSRLGGGEEDREALYSHIMWLCKDSDGPVMIAGDFNEDPEKGPSFMDIRLGRSVLPVTREPSEAGNGVFYCDSLAFPGKTTFAWDGRWWAYDHILLSSGFFDGEGLEHLETDVPVLPGMLGEDGFPSRFSPETGKGLSDHLPIVTRLRYNP